MLVYGDAERHEEAHPLLGRLLEALAHAWGLPAGVERHGALVGLLVETGMWAQGVLDADFAARGQQDAWSPRTEAVLALPLTVARAVAASWHSGFRQLPSLPQAPLRALQAERLPEVVRLRVPEGHAFYAVYPELYLEAARALPATGEGLLVVGLRSIGTSLACMVAAATDCRQVVTVRPVGHPFARTLSLEPGLRARLAQAARTAHVAVVDEGPGLSGSSFGAVADVLEEAGLPRARLHFLPSHTGPLGPQASAAHRERWQQARRHVADFDALLVRPPADGGAPRLAAWVEDVTGRALGPLEDVGGGRWRRHLFAREEAWPAAHVQQERRKFLLQAERGTFLLKFAGLGEVGPRKLQRARALEAAGFSPPVLALRHGFLVGPWLAQARPLPAGAMLPRAQLLDTLARYLAFRAQALPAGAGRGAGVEALWEMARHNAGLALGEACARQVEAWRPRLSTLAEAARPVETDGRLHWWEWLVLPEGRLLKADAVDHHAAHDLVGCQDVAWDVVGAGVELGLTAEEEGWLAEALCQRLGRSVASPETRAFYRTCYLAFQLGHHTLAVQALASAVPAEAERLQGAVGRYRALLQQVLA